jgi:hypothetical protein
MSELSSNSRALLDAARSARPTSAARARMDVALAAQIGVAALGVSPQVGTGAPGAAPAPPIAAPPPLVPAPLASVGAAVSIAKSAVIGALLGVVTVGTAAVWPNDPPRSWSPPPSVAAPASASIRAVENTAPPAPILSTAPSTALAEVVTPPLAGVATPRIAELPMLARERAASPRAVASVEAFHAAEEAARVGGGASGSREAASPPIGTVSLGEETALLGEAQRSLKQGNGARAVAVLDELAARHPAGVLREERLAARVFGLCAAGRVEEAREAGQRFLAEMPGSVQADRVRASCASSPSKPH